MWSRRMERINELLLREISRIVIEKQLSDVGIITFTGVQVTEDLMEAKVFYSVLGSEEERGRAAEALAGMKNEFFHEMRHLESLRRLPELNFIFDDTAERASRVFEILEKIHHESDEPPAPAAARATKKTKAPSAKTNGSTPRRKKTK